MKTMHTLLGFVFAASAFTLNVHAADIDSGFYGTPASEQSAGRVIEITPATRHVNVTEGETVTFRIGDQQFTWTFHMLHQEGALSLSAILPRGLRAEGVMVYVAADTSYR
jgi:hypothetical protein